ncbi:hypothetical protein AMELA_G00022000, partial [Ameiurus melas]
SPSRAQNRVHLHRRIREKDQGATFCSSRLFFFNLPLPVQPPPPPSPTHHQHAFHLPLNPPTPLLLLDRHEILAADGSGGRCPSGKTRAGREKTRALAHKRGRAGAGGGREGGEGMCTRARRGRITVRRR